MKQKIILIGASTGGPGHLKKILSALPDQFNMSIIIAQHMGSAFIPSFVNQFQSELKASVTIVDRRLAMSPSHIYICGNNSRFIKSDFSLIVEPFLVTPTPYTPSVDMLFTSAVEFCRDYDILAILLTGIGQDGGNGLSELQKKGAQCIAENEQSAIVYGMPKYALEINPNIASMHLDDIIKAIIKFGES